jgi:antitoxin (DNA-binding transcriptional repressor) of toxin-antitoxin stability system
VTECAEMPEWESRLARWLAGGKELESGAELEVRDSDGTVAFLAPLARHYRVDDGVLWVRPVVGGYEPPEGGLAYAFSLNQARARALPLDDVRLEGEEIVVATRASQVAHIRPASPETFAELERWDTFVLTVLDAEEEAALDQVEGDSWWGRWA